MTACLPPKFSGIQCIHYAQVILMEGAFWDTVQLCEKGIPEVIRLE